MHSLDLLDRLVAFPTVSGDSNVLMIDFVEDYLSQRGFEVHRIADDTGTKAGLFGRIGPAGPGGVMLSGHSDVVPADGEAWSGDPFRLRRDGDRLYARGTTDMKGFLASALALADRITGRRLREPLKLSISWDEEAGCLGIPQMLRHLGPTIGAPRLCIVGEPTSMQVATGHKGKASLRAICRGEAGHSSMAPDFINALHLAADFITGVREIQAELARTGARDEGYTVPYSTVHVGRMQGGTALNIVPEQAVIDLEYRHVAAESSEAIEDRLREAARRADPGKADCGVSLERLGGYPGLDHPPDTDCVREGVTLSGRRQTIKVGYGTEAGHFAAAGIPTVICGPGSMDQGHIADEFLAMDQLAACDAFMDRLADRLRDGT
ncbi:acetylornithine deacetylase [Tropicimonas aquimaris]|uniref:Acetylornithine deacetylase n=1 Tax=Tropicimonas aquimaris TaxID=914152 RepID=A0ABW3IJY6_9RHOB